MVADVGEGRQAYVLTLARAAVRPQMLRTLGPATLTEGSDVSTQDEHKRRWLA